MTRMMMVLLVLALAGCETIKGAGQDIQTAGQAITAEGTQAQAGM